MISKRTFGLVLSNYLKLEKDLWFLNIWASYILGLVLNTDLERVQKTHNPINHVAYVDKKGLYFLDDSLVIFIID